MACQELNGGGNLAPNQIAALAQQAGFTGQALVNAVAVALAESGGQPRIVNDCANTGDYSVGLWQVNYYGTLMPGRSQEFGTPSQLASDPAAQARAAYAISGGGRSFNAWSTYTSGAYRSQLGTAQQAVADIGQAAPVTAGAPSGTIDLTGAQLASSNTPASNSGDGNCLIKFPGTPLTSGFCLFQKSWLHGIEGVALVMAGSLFIAAGIFVLVEGRVPQSRSDISRVPNMVTNYRFVTNNSYKAAPAPKPAAATSDAE